MRSHETHHDDCGCLSARYEARIATLEAELATSREKYLALPKVECACHPGVRWPSETWGRACEFHKAERERDEWKRRSNALRDALEKVMRVTLQHEPMDTTAQQWLADARAALAQTPAQSLAAHDAEVGLRVAEAVREAVVESLDMGGHAGIDLASIVTGTIRALAAQEATHSVPDGTSEVKP